MLTTVSHIILCESIQISKEQVCVRYDMSIAMDLQTGYEFKHSDVSSSLKFLVKHDLCD